MFHEKPNERYWVKSNILAGWAKTWDINLDDCFILFEFERKKSTNVLLTPNNWKVNFENLIFRFQFLYTLPAVSNMVHSSFYLQMIFTLLQ